MFDAASRRAAAELEAQKHILIARQLLRKPFKFLHDKLLNQMAPECGPINIYDPSCIASLIKFAAAAIHHDDVDWLLACSMSKHGVDHMYALWDALIILPNSFDRAKVKKIDIPLAGRPWPARSQKLVASYP